jgi:uncharacterized protein
MSTPLWNKKTKCPFCHESFETTRMRSGVIKITEKESDFGNIYDGECAYLYAVTVCPKCTFAALNKDFESVKAEYEPKVMEVCKKILKSDKKKPDIFGLGTSTPEVAAVRHELAIAFMKKRAYSERGDMAGLHMHLVWIYRLAKEQEKEQVALAEATKAYQDYFEKGSKLPDKLGEPGILYLIGELLRRQGLFREARRYYEQALASREIKSYPLIANMTRDMMLTAKEQMEKAKTA